MNKRIASLLLALVAASVPGRGQQGPAPRLEGLLAQAQQAQSTGNYAAAADAYAQAVKVSPGTAELWANLGLMQHEANQSSAEMASFRQANRLNPSLYVPNLFLGIDYAHAGKASEAIPFLIRANRINTKDPQAPLALGRAYIAAGNFTSAASELERAARLDPRLGAAWFTLGIARLDQVETDAHTMSEEGKQSPFSGALYAQSLVKQARYGEAASLYRTLLDAQPQPPCVRSQLGFALLRHDTPAAKEQFAAERAAHPECGLAILGQARIALANGDSGGAAELLNLLWGRDHGFVESNAAMFADGLPDAQSAVLADLVNGSVSPLDPELRAALQTALNMAADVSDVETSHAPAASGASSGPGAAALYAAGEFGKCEQRQKSLQGALKVEDLRLLAACAFLTGDNLRASAAAAALRKLQPNSMEALYWSIQANEKLAFESLARFQQIEPDSHRSHILLGDIYHQLERFRFAESEYQQALAMKPDDLAAMLGLASSYLSDNNVEAAAATAQTALQRTPDDPDLNLMMAEVKLARNQYGEALPYLEKGLHAKPQMLPRVHALIGKAYAETGRTEEAIEQLKMGASSDEDGSIEYLLARLYRKTGDARDAAIALDAMKSIKDKRRERGYKLVEDPELSPVDSPLGEASAP